MNFFPGQAQRGLEDPVVRTGSSAGLDLVIRSLGGVFPCALQYSRHSRKRGYCLSLTLSPRPKAKTCNCALWACLIRMTKEANGAKPIA